MGVDGWEAREGRALWWRVGGLGIYGIESWMNELWRFLVSVVVIRVDGSPTFSSSVELSDAVISGAFILF